MFERIHLGIKAGAIASAVCAMACAAAIAAPAPAFADEYAEAEAALQSLNNMMSRLDEANANYNAALAAQDEAEQKVAEAQATIDQKTAQIEGYQQKLSTRARSMYRSGNATFLDVVFGSASFDEFAKNLDLLNDLNAEDAKIVADAKVARDELEAAKAQLEEESRKAAQATEEAARLQAQANEMAAQAQASYQAAMANPQTVRLLEAQGVVETQEQAIPQEEIVAFDEATGYATLSDGTQARVVGYDSATGNAIVDLAMSFVGGNYQWGAEDASTSTFDCSGLVQYVYGQSGIAVGGHNDRAILNAGTVVDASEAQAGDILWWDGHVAIYTGDGMMVSADNEEYGITYREVSDGATYVRY